MKITAYIIKYVLVFSLLFNNSLILANDETSFSASPSTHAEVIRGLVKPAVSAVISSEISAQIEKLPYRNGDTFKKGDLLVKFDCGLFSARLASTKATHKSKQKTLDNLKRLLSLNASSDVDVELAQIEVEKTRADLNAAAVLVRRCAIKAPYSGRIIETRVNQYESVSEGQELLSILDDKELEIEVIVPSNWLVWMKVGDRFDFHVDEVQKSFAAEIKQIGATVDPVSQTISIKSVFIEEAAVLAGMSGSAYFEQAK